MRLVCVFVTAILMSTTVEAQNMTATWYANENGQYRRADGQRYNPNVPGFACRGWRLGSMHSVTNLANGRTITIPCNDRAGYGVPGSGIDLSRGAARMLGITGRGRVRVE